ncbi:MAG: hypothetical protein WB770_05175 [Acidimicrobiales bacterium]
MRNWLWGHRLGARELGEPRSMVHVLRDDEELRSALEHVIESERATASRASELISRYEAMEPHNVLVSIPVRSSDNSEDGQPQVRSA